MKKLLAIILCMTITFTSTLRPTLAAAQPTYNAPEGFESYVPYTTDENGYITGVNPQQTYSLGSLLISGGAMGVPGFIGGVGSIATGAGVLLSLLAAAGVTIWAVDGIVTKVSQMYNSMSEESRTELENIWSLGATAFTISATLADDFAKVFKSLFYADDVFVTTGTAFTATSLLQYDYSLQWVYGNTLGTSIYKYPLSTTAVAIAGTPLTVQLVENPPVASEWDSSEVPYGFKLVNQTTGVTATFTPPASNDFVLYDCSTYSIAAPFVESFISQTGETIAQLGIWVLSECALRAADEYCEHHDYIYQSREYRDGDLLNHAAAILLTGTGTLLDGNLVNGWTDGADGIDIWFDTAVEGLTSICLATTPLGLLLLEDTYSISLNDTYALPTEDETFYLPDEAVFQDVETLTAEGVRTGDFNTTIDGAGTGTDLSLWERLWAWLQSIIDAITGIPEALVKALSVMVDWISTGVTTALKAMFIPDAAFFENYFSELRSTFENRFGLLTYPISVIFNFMDALLNVSEQEPVFRWNAWSYRGKEFLAAGEYNLNDILENETFARIYDIYLVVVDAFIVFAFLKFIERKYRSIISN